MVGGGTRSRKCGSACRIHRLPLTLPSHHNVYAPRCVFSLTPRTHSLLNAGMMGVVVEVVVEVRPRIPVSTRGFTKGVKSGAAAVRAVLSARANCDALFAILVPDRDYVYLEARRKVCVCV